MYNIPAIIFAGGKSSRMGKDKALLPFRTISTMSEYQYRKLQNLFCEVYLSVKKNKFDFSCTIIKDIYPESSPLIGLVSALNYTKSDAIFVLSVDAPLVDTMIIHSLMQNYKKHPTLDAIIAQSPKGIQPLCGIYNKSILTQANKHLKADIHKLRALLQESNVAYISYDEEKMFSNINTPQEYEAMISLNP